MIAVFKKNPEVNPSLQDTVYANLRKSVFRGELKAGEQLRETHLAKEFSVSRTTIRGALRRLEQEGLVEVQSWKRQKKVVVSDVKLNDMEEVLEVHRALGTLAVRRAGRCITGKQIDGLRFWTDVFRKNILEEDVTACARADTAFCSIIYELAGNRYLIQIRESLEEQMYRCRMEYLKQHVECRIRLLGAHVAILNALQKQGGQEAADAVDFYIECQKSYMVSLS